MFLGDLIGALQYMKGAYKKNGETFNQAYKGRTRAKRNIMRLGRHWNKFPREVMDASFLEVFGSGWIELSAT